MLKSVENLGESWLCIRGWEHLIPTDPTANPLKISLQIAYLSPYGQLPHPYLCTPHRPPPMPPYDTPSHAPLPTHPYPRNPPSIRYLQGVMGWGTVASMRGCQKKKIF